MGDWVYLAVFVVAALAISAPIVFLAYTSPPPGAGPGPGPGNKPVITFGQVT